MIIDKQHYCSAISGYREYKYAKSALKSAYFCHESWIETVSNYACKHLLFPVVSSAYLVGGNWSSRVVSCFSIGASQWLRAGWTDPLSTQALLVMTQQLGYWTKPIASRKPLSLLGLSSISRSVIGLVRCLDVALKDISTALNALHQAAQVSSFSSLKVFIMGGETPLHKVERILAVIICSPIWSIFKVVDLAARLFQAIARKLNVGVDFAASAVEAVHKGERALFGGFQNKVCERETAVRKRLIHCIAAEGTQVLLGFLVTAWLRSSLTQAIAFSVFSGIRLLGQDNHLEVARWAVDCATVNFFFATSAALKIYSCAAFFQEFSENAERDYNPQKCTILYRKGLINGIFQYRKIKKLFAN